MACRAMAGLNSSTRSSRLFSSAARRASSMVRRTTSADPRVVGAVAGMVAGSVVGGAVESCASVVASTVRSTLWETGYPSSYFPKSQAHSPIADAAHSTAQHHARPVMNSSEPDVSEQPQMHADAEVATDERQME